MLLRRRHSRQYQCDQHAKVLALFQCCGIPLQPLWVVTFPLCAHPLFPRDPLSSPDPVRRRHSDCDANSYICTTRHYETCQSHGQSAVDSTWNFCQSTHNKHQIESKGKIQILDPIECLMSFSLLSSATSIVLSYERSPLITFGLPFGRKMCCEQINVPIHFLPVQLPICLDPTKQKVTKRLCRQ